MAFHQSSATPRKLKPTTPPAFATPFVLALAIHGTGMSTSYASVEQSNDQAIDEITVYSTLDNSTLDQLAASASIRDGETITVRNAQHIDQLAATIPNLNFSGGAARGRFAQIRGIGDIEQFVDPKAYPSVGLVVDGIELNGLFGAGLLFDADQVEVLRGPQGTRFGASALAGAINIISTDARDSSNNFVEAGIGRFASRQFGGAYSAEVSESLSARISLNQFRSDGYIENNFRNEENTGDFDEFLGRLKLNWDFANGEDLGLTFLHIDNDNGYDAFSLDNTENRTLSDEPGEDKQRVNAIALTHGYEFGENSRIESRVTGLRANTLYSFDEDWINASFCGTDPTCLANQFSSFDSYQRTRDEYTADIRYSDDRLVVGVYAQDSEVDLRRDYTFLAEAFTSSYELSRFAIYSQSNFNLSDKLLATIGMRLERFEDDYQDGSQESDTEDTLWSADASLRYAIDDNHALYLLVARGEKAGGVNTDATSNFGIATPPAQAELVNRLRYASETLTNFEIGFSADNPAKGIRTRTSVFYNKRNNPQFETFLLDFPPPAGFLFIGYLDNASRATSRGIEFEGFWRVSERLELTGSMALINASIEGLRVYDFDAFTFTTIDSKDQPRAPSYQYSISGSYALTDIATVTLQLEGRDDYEFAYYFSERSGNINRLHASLRLDFNPIEVNFWVRNALDQRSIVQGLYFANDPRDAFAANNLYTQSGEPRNLGVTFRLNLGE